ncbi:MAG: hypothetical protein U0790_21505 [Isosphaeraceae bacterium]
MALRLPRRGGPAAGALGPTGSTSRALAAGRPGSRQLGRFRDLLGDRRWARPRLGLVLAAVGMGTFWGVGVAGQDLAVEMLTRSGVPADEAAEPREVRLRGVADGRGGLGLLAFGPLAEPSGRRKAFALMHVLALLVVPLTCYGPQTPTQLMILLPVFGFCILSIHAGYAVYFPELFPDHLRATGAGFCFNGGRLAAAPILVFAGQLKALPGMDLRLAMTLLGLLYLVGLVVLLFLPETRGRALPEG